MLEVNVTVYNESIRLNYFHYLIIIRSMDKYAKTIQTFNDVAELYWDKFRGFELYHASYDNFLTLLSNHSLNENNSFNLLEIACGPGHVSHYLLNQNPNIKLLGIDLAPKMIELAKKHNPEAEYQIMDCRLTNQINANFDAIMCGFCLPYLSWQDSQNLIQSMHSKLNPGGILYLSGTEGELTDEGLHGSKSAAGSIYMHYHETDAIINSLTSHDFEILSKNRLTHIHNEQPTTDVIIMAKKS